MTNRTIAMTVLTVLAGLAATATAEAKTTLTLSSASIRAGDVLRITGSGWPKRRGISIYLSPRGDVRQRVAGARTDRRGRFRRSLRLGAGSAAGSYLLTACSARCHRARTVRLTVTDRTTTTPPPPSAAASPGAPPTSSAPPPPSTPAALAELERRLKNTRWTRSDSLGNCAIACDASQTTYDFCADMNWTLASKSSGNASGGAYNVRVGGIWRVLSATTSADGSVRGEIGLKTFPNVGPSGGEMKGAVALGAPGSTQATFNGLAYTVGPGCA